MGEIKKFLKKQNRKESIWIYSQLKAKINNRIASRFYIGCKLESEKNLGITDPDPCGGGLEYLHLSPC
jgi:hypothetical protein